MTNVPVTDADREASAAVLDKLEIAGCYYAREVEKLAQAIARARAEEREACELALALVERPKKFRADPIRRDTFDDTVAACMDALRARGERFPLSGADAPSEGGKA